MATVNKLKHYEYISAKTHRNFLINRRNFGENFLEIFSFWEVENVPKKKKLEMFKKSLKEKHGHL